MAQGASVVSGQSSRLCPKNLKRNRISYTYPKTNQSKKQSELENGLATEPHTAHSCTL